MNFMIKNTNRNAKTLTHDQQQQPGTKSNVCLIKLSDSFLLAAGEPDFHGEMKLVDDKNRRVILKDSLFEEPDMSSCCDLCRQCIVKKRKYPGILDYTQNDWPVIKDMVPGTSSIPVMDIKLRNASKEQKNVTDEVTLTMNMSKAESMMRKMGWKGGALGKAGEGILEPIAPNTKYISSTVGFGQDHRPAVQTPAKKTKESRLVNKRYKRRTFKTNLLLYVLNFVRNIMEREVLFDSALRKFERMHIHQIIDLINKREDSSKVMKLNTVEQQHLFRQILTCNTNILGTNSEGEQPNRRLCLYKIAPGELDPYKHLKKHNLEDEADDENDDNPGDDIINYDLCGSDFILDVTSEYIDVDHDIQKHCPNHPNQDITKRTRNKKASPKSKNVAKKLTDSFLIASGNPDDDANGSNITDFVDDKNRRVILRSPLLEDPDMSICCDLCKMYMVQKRQYPDGFEWTRHLWFKSEHVVPVTSSVGEMNKAESIMRKMGWEGGALGKDGDGIIVPIVANTKYVSTTIGFGQEHSAKGSASNKKKQPKFINKNCKKRYFKTNVLLCILEFVRNDMEQEVLFDSTLNQNEKIMVHQIIGLINKAEDNWNLMKRNTAEQEHLLQEIYKCNNYVLITSSEGTQHNRRLCLYKRALGDLHPLDRCIDQQGAGDNVESDMSAAVFLSIEAVKIEASDNKEDKL